MTSAPLTKNWQVATLYEARLDAKNVKTLRFTVDSWVEPKAGQHYDIRLTAPNGYQAERSYSLANPPEEKGILEFGIQLLSDGEVSPYLWQLQKGEQVEVRGPIGGHFIWHHQMPGPLVLIGGGSGMVPLMSMLRHWVLHQKEDSEREIVFLISARDLEYVLYRDELTKIQKIYKNVRLVITITDTPQANWHGYTRRIDRAMITETLSFLKDRMPMVYVCGPTPFVEAVSKELLSVGFGSHEIRTERFGGA
jgi:ferredoxin-NADP reductase